MRPPTGLHHITAIAGPAQENLDFYSGVLGMRLVKRSVNQDDPGTYHLFYADSDGHPGTDLTFFPWARRAPSRDGHGLSSEVSLSIPPGSAGYWAERLTRLRVALQPTERRFGRTAIPLTDPHGLRVALVENDDAMQRPFAAWRGSAVPPERQIRGLETARMVERDLGPTTTFLTTVLGFSLIGEEDGWQRYGLGTGTSGAYVDLRETGSSPRGAWGVGSIHHLAWRVDDQAHQVALREQVDAAGRRPTPVIDRFWFQSVYFLEPGGVLFELATDGPGFSVDEDPAHLGESLVLPPWLEAQRGAIESVLPTLQSPAAAGPE